MLPHNPPVPVSATIEAATSIVRVTFDRDLITGLSAKGNWVVKADIGTGPKTHTINGANPIFQRVVTIPTTLAGITFPPLGVTYAASPADVVSRTGVAAASFANLPIVTV